MIYSDQTGNFPVQSYHVEKHTMVIYEYRSNAIIIKPLKINSDESILEAFNEVSKYLTSKNLHPKLHIMDNRCSKAVVKQIKKQTPKYS